MQEDNLSEEQVTTQSSPNFDSIRQVNPYNQEYWSARELSKLLGYSEWRNFEVAIKRAEKSCEQTGQNVKYHFVEANKMIPLGKGGQRQIKDYILSRFGAYLIAQNGDPEKPEIAAAQAYFAAATRENELRVMAQDQAERLALREQLTENNKSLVAAAQRAGVLSHDFGTFQDAGYKGMYGGLGVQGIKARKGVPDKEDLSDRMGRAELAAHNFRTTLTEQKLSNEGIIGSRAASQAHNEVGQRIRKTIQETGGTLPEDLPPEPNIKPLLNERKRRQRKAAQPKEQTKLFGDEK